MSERYRRHEAVVPTFEIKGRGMPRHPEHVVYRFTDTAQNESVAIAKITKDFPFSF